MNLKQYLERLTSVKGFLGIAVFTPDGEALEAIRSPSIEAGINKEFAGALINNTLLIAQDMARDIGLGRINFLQIDTLKGTVIIKCYNVSDIHFHTILFLKKDGNIAMGKLLLQKAIEGLAQEF